MVALDDIDARLDVLPSELPPILPPIHSKVDSLSAAALFTHRQGGGVPGYKIGIETGWRHFNPDLVPGNTTALPVGRSEGARRKRVNFKMDRRKLQRKSTFPRVDFAEGDQAVCPSSSAKSVSRELGTYRVQDMARVLCISHCGRP